MKHFLTISLAVVAITAFPVKGEEPHPRDVKFPHVAFGIYYNTMSALGVADDYGIGDWMPVVIPKHFTFTISADAMQGAGHVFEDPWKGCIPILVPGTDFEERMALMKYIAILDPGARIYVRNAWAESD